MRNFVTKKSVIAGITVGLLSVSGSVAYAYWTYGGSGTGFVVTAPVADIHVTQTGTPGGLAPGGSVALQGNFVNGNTVPLSVTALTGTVTSVVNPTTATDISTTCKPSWFKVTGTLTSAPLSLQANSNTGWSGLSLNMPVDNIDNQDACKGVYVNITYTPTVQQ